MIDFVLGAGLVALVVRGWFRGLIREAIGLGVIVAGAFLAFRLAGPMGAIVSAMSGAGEDASRIAGGIVVFILVSVGGAVLSWIANKGVRALPGLTTANRFGGAAFSAAATILAATVVVSALAVIALPSGSRDALNSSTLVGRMTDSDGLPQKALGLISFDSVLRAAIQLQSVAGENRLVAPERGRVDIEAFAESDLRRAAKAAANMAELVNRARVEAGVDPLARSAGLDEVAYGQAVYLYTAGRLSHNSPGGRITARLDSAAIPVFTAGEAIALAPSPRSALEAMLGDAVAEADIESATFRRTGVAVVKGPLGMLTVVVLAG